MSGDAATELLREEIAQLAAVRISEWESEASFQEFADGVLDLPSVRRLLADRQAVQRVRDALDEDEAYTREVELTGIPKSEYGPSEWRLHGDARGRRMVIAGIRAALDRAS